MPSNNYDAMSDREIDGWIATRVMGWQLVPAFDSADYEPCDFWRTFDGQRAAYAQDFHPSTDRNAAHAVGEQMKTLGLGQQWSQQLLRLIGPEYVVGDMPIGFHIAQASARFRCEAALRVMDQQAQRGQKAE
jgi:hypothetical protein